MKQDFLFLTFLMVLMNCLLLVSQKSHEMYGEGVDLRRQNEKLSAELSKAQLETRIASQRLFDYGQNVAMIMGRTPNRDWKQLSLLQVSRLPASADNKPAESVMLMSRGKTLFNEGHHMQAIEAFQQLEREFPGSPGTIEAKFLRAESYYALGQLDQCLDVIDDMMTFYPEHPMTGYLMLRLSQILQYRKRTPEALDILRMVRANFSQERGLQQQVATLEKKFSVK